MHVGIQTGSVSKQQPWKDPPSYIIPRGNTATATAKEVLLANRSFTREEVCTFRSRVAKRLVNKVKEKILIDILKVCLGACYTFGLFVYPLTAANLISHAD